MNWIDPDEYSKVSMHTYMHISEVLLDCACDSAAWGILESCALTLLKGNVQKLVNRRRNASQPIHAYKHRQLVRKDDVMLRSDTIHTLHTLFGNSCGLHNTCAVFDECKPKMAGLSEHACLGRGDLYCVNQVESVFISYAVHQ